MPIADFSTSMMNDPINFFQSISFVLNYQKNCRGLFLQIIVPAVLKISKEIVDKILRKLNANKSWVIIFLWSETMTTDWIRKKKESETFARLTFYS